MRRRFFPPSRPLALAVGLALSAAASASTIVAPAMRAPGTVAYTAEGVPVIQAANDFDAAFLTGWAHARDRFWQMDRLRRVGSGTLAELLGPAALANDVQLRTLGLRRAAWESWAAASEETRGSAEGLRRRRELLAAHQRPAAGIRRARDHQRRSLAAGGLLRGRQAARLPALLRPRHRSHPQPRRLSAGRPGRQLQRHRAVLRGRVPARARAMAG
ncbi:MAG: penicillin acylase family protein [Xanthomonadales bacterium]|nr:penicillin acylase family protein [Xanthomonadales bacterium]